MSMNLEFSICNTGCYKMLPCPTCHSESARHGSMVTNHPCLPRTEKFSSAKTKIDPGKLVWKSPYMAWALSPAPALLHSKLPHPWPPQHPQPQGIHPLPNSPAPHCPLQSKHSHQLLEVTLNSFMPYGPPFLPLSAEEVGGGGWSRCSPVP